jgi:5-methylcytosine-specific restriction endonuclease McrA
MMKLKEIVQEIENRNSTEELTKKRYACAHCGTTWIELIGLVVGRKDGNEDLCLRIGMESETCETCRMKARECQRCGSKDIYEIRFANEVDNGVPLSFKGIRRVSRG